MLHIQRIVEMSLYTFFTMPCITSSSCWVPCHTQVLKHMFQESCVAVTISLFSTATILSKRKYVFLATSLFKNKITQGKILYWIVTSGYRTRVKWNKCAHDTSATFIKQYEKNLCKEEIKEEKILHQSSRSPQFWSAIKCHQGFLLC